jgi:dihydroorotate dehydrogenase (fumarate)
VVDLTTKYLGLTLRSPLVASASPLSGNLDGIRRLEEAGAGAIVLPSLFEEQIEHDSFEIDRVLDTGAGTFAEAMTLFPELEDYNTGPTDYLRLVARAKAMSRVPVIASLNGTSMGGWTRYARLLQEAGADALELNVYLIAADTETTAESIEDRYVELVESVRSTIDIPLAVKIGPYFTAMANMAWKLVEAGAEGLVLFNRFYQPDIDPDALEVVPHLVLSTSDESRLTVRWIALLRDQIPGSLAATTGMHTVEDVVKALLAGADVTMLASALLRRGPEYLGELEAGLIGWLREHEYASVDQLRGSMSSASVTNPSAFERANYMKTISTYANGART